MEAAALACYQLGHSGLVSRYDTVDIGNTDNYSLATVNCEGTEMNWSGCEINTDMSAEECDGRVSVLICDAYNGKYTIFLFTQQKNLLPAW